MSLALQKILFFNLRARVIYKSITYDYLETKRMFLFAEVDVRIMCFTSAGLLGN